MPCRWRWATRQGAASWCCPLRGNAQADSVLQGVPAARHGLMMEAMTAHEIGHCQRYAQGDWHALPRGFVEPRSMRPGKLTPLTQDAARDAPRRGLC